MRVSDVEQLLDGAAAHLFDHVSFVYGGKKITLNTASIDRSNVKHILTEEFRAASEAIRSMQRASAKSAEVGYILKQNVVYRVAPSTTSIEKITGTEAKAVRRLFK